MHALPACFTTADLLHAPRRLSHPLYAQKLGIGGGNLKGYGCQGLSIVGAGMAAIELVSARPALSGACTPPHPGCPCPWSAPPLSHRPTCRA